MQKLDFAVNANDGQNNETFRLELNTRSGAVIALVIADRETGQALARVHVPPMAATTLGQALSLAGTMKMTEEGS